MIVKKLVTLALGTGAAIAAIAALSLPTAHQSVEAAVPIPGPRTNVIATEEAQVAVFAGGCFWGMEAVFQHVRGVRSVRSGYAGGSADTATYEQVGTGRTGHAEAVRIVMIRTLSPMANCSASISRLRMIRPRSIARARM